MMATESAVADSAAYDDMAYDSGYDTTEAASAEEAGSGAVTSENGIEEVQETDRKLIRNVNLSLQTKEFDTVLDNMSQKIKDLGGYIQDSSVWGAARTIPAVVPQATHFAFRLTNWMNLSMWWRRWEM